MISRRFVSGLIIAVIIISADVNECDINNGNCQQMCKNLYGRHSCSCREGFVLDTNKRTCSGKRFKHSDKEIFFMLHYSGLYNDVYIAVVLFIIGLCKPEIAVCRLRDLKSRLEILLSLCSPVTGIILTAHLMVAMILLLLKILMSVSWDKMIVITFAKTIQWVVTDAGVTKVTSCLVTIEHAKVKKQSREKMVHTSNKSEDALIP